MNPRIHDAGEEEGGKQLLEIVLTNVVVVLGQYDDSSDDLYLHVLVGIIIKSNSFGISTVVAVVATAVVGVPERHFFL